jgi:UDP-glucose 4-epimerase
LSATVQKLFCSGATGYIGGAILRALADEGIAAIGGVRAPAALPPGIAPFITGDLSTPGLRLPPVETVIHAAGLGHKHRESAKTWRRANLDSAVNLARAAAAAGASRFILISTAHIHGRAPTRLVNDTSPPNPQGAYAESKLQAEHEVAAAFGPGLSIIRPVAVIGPGCPGNIALLLNLLARGVPLPFAAIENQRSFIHRDDLARIVLAVLRSPAPPESVLAAHPDTISTPALIRALAAGLGVADKSFTCPPRLLGLGATLLGRSATWQSLAGNFIANPAAARQLGWKPQESLAESFHQSARYYNTTHRTP